MDKLHASIIEATVLGRQYVCVDNPAGESLFLLFYAPVDDKYGTRFDVAGFGILKRILSEYPKLCYSNPQMQNYSCWEEDCVFVWNWPVLGRATESKRFLVKNRCSDWWITGKSWVEYTE